MHGLHPPSQGSRSGGLFLSVRAVTDTLADPAYVLPVGPSTAHSLFENLPRRGEVK